MSFELVCHSCGAPSGGSVGVCPYCKTVMDGAETTQESADFVAIKKAYDKGDLARALRLFQSVNQKQNETLEENLGLLGAKIMLEAEAPSSRLRALLEKLYLAYPENQEILDYLDIIEAKYKLSKQSNDLGEQILKHVLQRSPNNPHANFFLGAHLLHIEGRVEQARPYLQKSVTSLPTFLRAWGCLGALFEKKGNPEIARRCYEKALELEKKPYFRKFLEEAIERQKGNKQRKVS